MSKKRKIGRKSKAIADPFSGSRKTERSAAAVLMHWMRGIIEEKQLDLGLPDVETIGKDGKLPDLVIYESRRSKNVLCLIEAKPPHWDVFSQELRETARGKASKRNAKYFGTTNFKSLAWFNTQKANEGKPEEDQLVEKCKNCEALVSPGTHYCPKCGTKVETQKKMTKKKPSLWYYIGVGASVAFVVILIVIVILGL